VRGVVNRVGALVTFTRETVTGYDPETGVHASTTKTFTIKAIIAGYTFKQMADSGGLLRIGDVQIMTADTSYIPLEGDTVSADGKTYRVLRHDPDGISGANLIQARLI